MAKNSTETPLTLPPAPVDNGQEDDHPAHLKAFSKRLPDLMKQLAERERAETDQAAAPEVDHQLIAAFVADCAAGRLVLGENRFLHLHDQCRKYVTWNDAFDAAMEKLDREQKQLD